MTNQQIIEQLLASSRALSDAIVAEATAFRRWQELKAEADSRRNAYIALLMRTTGEDGNPMNGIAATSKAFPNALEHAVSSHMEAEFGKLLANENAAQARYLDEKARREAMDAETSGLKYAARMRMAQLGASPAIQQLVGYLD